LTAQEVSQFYRFGLKPIIFVLNNDGYLIERLLCKDPEIDYNNLAQWHYQKLPEALGCDGWFTTRVTTCGDLDKAIEKAEGCGTGAYIEVVTDKYVALATGAEIARLRRYALRVTSAKGPKSDIDWLRALRSPPRRLQRCDRVCEFGI
jgi:TPP-dependent 2-oxoacid decarboxylase